jgi:hypothetical protein
VIHESERTEEPPPLVDRGQAFELFIDGYQGASLSNGMVKFNLFSNRLNATTGQAERVVVCHLTMPISTFVAVHRAFGALLHSMQQQGVFVPEDRTDEKG